MRGIVLVCLVGVNALTATLAASAEAECAMPAPATFPEAETVPPDPVIYRFEMEYAAAPVLSIVGGDGRAIEYTASIVGPHRDIRATEIHVAAKRGTFTVSGGEYDVPKTYRIAAATKPHVAPVVDGVSWVQSSWTCSHEIGMVVEARGADVAAFRVLWSNGYDELIPANDTAFWSRMSGGERDPNALRAFLGHPNCVGNLIDDRYIGRKDFQLFARYADGTEMEVELPREPEARQPGTANREPGTGNGGAPVRPERAKRVEGRMAALIALMGLSGMVTISTLVLAYRRRRRTTMVP
jgi:hypothetical protein